MGLNVSGVDTLHLLNPVKNPSVVVNVKALTGTRRENETKVKEVTTFTI
jgi:hypothetical protein